MEILLYMSKDSNGGVWLLSATEGDLPEWDGEEWDTKLHEKIYLGSNVDAYLEADDCKFVEDFQFNLED